jgi:hypothetical protein
MKATIGRIVQYRTTPEDQKRMGENPHNTVRAILPAIVTAVNEDGTVNLSIVLDGYGNIYAPNVILGDGEGQYAWPVRESEVVAPSLSPDPQIPSSHKVIVDNPNQRMDYHLNSLPPLSPNPEIPSSQKVIGDNPEQPVATIKPTGQAEVISSDAAKTETVSPVAAPTEASQTEKKKADAKKPAANS